MRATKKMFSLCLLPLILAGCATSITNMTPAQQVRTPTGMYPFEVKFSTTKQSIQKDTIKSYVLIGNDTYAMQPVPMVKSRWETVIPVPPEKNVIYYQYKFDYEYLSMPQRAKDSKLSKTYQLKVLDK